MQNSALDLLAVLRQLGCYTLFVYEDGRKLTGRAVLSPYRAGAAYGGDALGQLDRRETLYIGMPEIPLGGLAYLSAGGRRYYVARSDDVMLGDVTVYTRAVLRPYEPEK